MGRSVQSLSPAPKKWKKVQAKKTVMAVMNQDKKSSSRAPSPEGDESPSHHGKSSSRAPSPEENPRMISKERHHLKVKEKEPRRNSSKEAASPLFGLTHQNV